MGFGSYDESEQENQELDTESDEESAVDKGGEYDGEMNFESEDADTLLEQYQNEVKDDEDNKNADDEE